MDPDQTSLRVHARLAGMLSQLLTPRICKALEYILFGIAVALFGLLVVMHTNFVQQPGCSTELSKIDISEYQLVQIKITRTSFWFKDVATGSKADMEDDDISVEKAEVYHVDASGSGQKSTLKSWKSEKELNDPPVDTLTHFYNSRISKEMENHDDRETQRASILFSKRESIKAAIIYAFSKWQMHFYYFWKTLKQLSLWARQLWSAVDLNAIKDIPEFLQIFHFQQMKTFLVQWLERRGRASEPTFLFTLEKGYFLLPEGAKALHNIRTINISVSAQNSCFGNRWQRFLINTFVGYDSIMMNSLLSFPGKGFLYSSQTEEFYSLGYGLEQSDGSARFVDYVVTKCSVLIMSLFVFFTTTMSVSFTLRETQSRMLKFTVQLQHHARHNLPTFQLIFVHVIESLVFVPIMIGILFFLFEFYDDQMLAFLVLALVWLCELFTMISSVISFCSVRTPISMQFFPRFFLLYFLVFHIYLFSYSYGFSYLALFTTAAFMQHLILYFWNHYEVPALRRFMSNRSHLQRQGGVHITSSTIVTSTLHIARVNVGDQTPQMGPMGLTSDESPENRAHEQTPVGNSNPIPSLPFPELNMQPAAGPNNAGLLNPFGSMLLSLLGGASSEGLISFFSMFRDLRDPHHVYAQQPHHGDEPAM
ncbi:S3 self-incompatibility locus-linked pollen protein isoform X2 [Wolffia australiana]